MAVRLINLHQQTLRVDLRGGEVLLLDAGQRSAALREELLYDNTHLAEWERAGWISRVPARLSEVTPEPSSAAPAVKEGGKKPPSRKAPAPKKAAKNAAKKATARKR
jgi:hypothetical protein